MSRHRTTPSQPLYSHFDTLEQQAEAASLGMWLFLASEVLFFAGLFMGYTYLRWCYPDEVAAASRELALLQGGLNTFILLTSSFAVAMGVLRSHEGAWADASRWFAKSGWMGVAFLAVKGSEYVHAVHAGHLPTLGGDARSLFFWLYFVMTGLHALHVLIGVVMLFLVAFWMRRPEALSLNTVRNSGLYWHFVDLVWVFLFPLLYLAGHRPLFP